MSSVADNLAFVLDRIAIAARESGREPDSVRLVAVSKRQPFARVQVAYDEGQRDFGENYVPGLLDRMERLPADARLHMIGHLQRNKAKKVSRAALVHSVDSTRLADALSGPDLRVLIEVNLGGEGSKTGASRDETAALARHILGTTLRLEGLMCIPPFGLARPYFAALRALRDELEVTLGASLPELSMGMSGDYEDAVREGATLVRVGTAIFGDRDDH